MSDTEDFWRGAFGTEYTERNSPDYKARIPFWQHIVDATGCTAFLDVGCNKGFNLQALRAINPQFELSGVDINPGALRIAQGEGFDVVECPADGVVEVFGHRAAQLTVTSGVLIHIAPEDLLSVMTAIRDVTSQYVLAVEYESPDEREIEYRGNAGKLWARPFGKLYEALGLSLVEYGEAQGFDRCHYWLMER